MKRNLATITCDQCGKTFTQSRWWQAFCSETCSKAAHRANVASYRRTTAELAQAKATIRDLEGQVEALQAKLRDALEMPVRHSGGYRGASTPSSKPFRYDDEDQSQRWKEG